MVRHDLLNPILKPITENLWSFEQEARLAGGLRLPSRTTVIRRSDGGLVLHSPLAFAEEDVAAIDALGEVKAIVAPSCIHFLHLAAATTRWPRARVLGPPGLEKKLPSVAFEPLPHDGRTEALGDDLEIRRIDGVPYMTEHVFLHRPSRSLVVTDLVFNVHRCTSFGTRLFLRFVSGAYGKTAQSRMWRWLTKDQASAAASANAVLAWELDRVIVAHGDVIEENAHGRLREALASMTAVSSPKLLNAAAVQREEGEARKRRQDPHGK